MLFEYFSDKIVNKNMEKYVKVSINIFKFKLL